MKRFTLIIPLYLKIFERKSQLKMSLIYQVLTKQCLKKVFAMSNDFDPNSYGLLKYAPH